MKNNINKIILIFLLFGIASCQKEDAIIPEQEVIQHTEDIKVITNFDDLDVSKSSFQSIICSFQPIPTGFRVVGYLYDYPGCPNYPPFFLGIYNAALIEPIGLPRISRAGAGCEDNYCIWIVGSDFEEDAYVDIRTTSGSAIIGTYRGSNRVQYVNDQGQDVITLRLESALERNEFASRGLRIWVVNPEARKWGDGRTVRRPRDSGDGGPIEPPCNPICP
ncbi:hypothetical protein [Aquimarina sp. RZ0]|uniref:hypothetical protein n=1 Tax=Aquimarina sp. RZ0 TaxID=2607730 RepID=UPI0011F337C4|nr:hypothetical protein [Aquimarina sp. RZ0]KAA1245063.1 hypothetical protein F0000_13720 [Aquimarina sp. RZ0]